MRILAGNVLTAAALSVGVATHDAREVVVIDNFAPSSPPARVLGRGAPGRPQKRGTHKQRARVVAAKHAARRHRRKPSKRPAQR